MLEQMIRAALTCMALAFPTALLTACDGGTSSESQSVNDSGDSGTGACIANGARCGDKDGTCVGDCRGRTCCSGLCADPLCTPANVDFAPTCPPAPCGG